MHIFTGIGSAIVAAATLFAALFCSCLPAETSAATDAQSQRIIIPESSRAKPGDKGKRAHTNYEIRDTHGPITPPKPSRTAPAE